MNAMSSPQTIAPGARHDRSYCYDHNMYRTDAPWATFGTPGKRAILVVLHASRRRSAARYLRSNHLARTASVLPA